MTEFKIWHDSESVFHAQETVYFSLCNDKGQISLHEILKTTSDVAVEDYRQRGLSSEVLKNNGYAILVSRCSFRFFRLPKQNEKITITTWEEKADALQLKRAYEITAENGETLIVGYSGWIIADPVTRKLIPTKNFTMRPIPQIQKEHDCIAPGRINVPDNAELLAERIIYYSDIDGNAHTNNARYAAFIMDALPAKYREKDFFDFRINFSKEATLGQKLYIYASFNDEEKRILIKGVTENVCSFESEIIYK